MASADTANGREPRGSGAAADPALPDRITEVSGRFASDAALQDAVARLTRAGFDRAALSVPLAHPASDEATPERGAQDPNTEDDQRQIRTLGSSTAAAGAAMAGAAITVATGGAAAVAVAAAAAAGLAAGGVTYASTGDATDHAGREQRARAGELQLTARIFKQGDAERARTAMREAGGEDVLVVERGDDPRPT
jgi:fructose-1,6-bisphosphatase/inositol monophosphatase family enzyme